MDPRGGVSPVVAAANSPTMRKVIFDRACTNVFAQSFNASRYWLDETTTDLRSVQFLSRQNSNGDQQQANPILLDAWLLSRDNFTNLPTAIVVHDLRGCKRQHQSLLPASLLFNSDFNVLLLDLRNHGESYFDTLSSTSSLAHMRFGDVEYRDILGAVDYLMREHGEKDSVRNRLVLYGVGMGASAAMIAYEREPLFKALYVDSPICNTFDTIIHGLKSTLGPLSYSMSKGSCVHNGNAAGCAPFHNDPLKSAKKLKGRPVFFEHNVHDATVPIYNSKQCVNAVESVNKQPLTSEFEYNTVHVSNDTMVQYYLQRIVASVPARTMQRSC